MIRKYPWHVRKASLEERLYFDRLMDLHRMTRTWLEELSTENIKPSYQLVRIKSPGVEEKLKNFLQFGQIAFGKDIDELLSDLFPDELLDLLHQMVWQIQAWTLKSLKDQATREQQEDLIAVLEKNSFQQGRLYSQNVWKTPHPELTQSISLILEAFHTTPIGFGIDRPSFLVLKKSQQEAWIEWLTCPFQSPYASVRENAEILYRLHQNWLHGFAYQLNSKVTVEAIPGNAPGVYRQHWHFYGLPSNLR